MEQLIAKPLKRFFYTTKQYANKHISEKFTSVHYTANPELDTSMTEIKSIIRSPTKLGDTNVTLKNERNVLFDEVAQIHAIDMSESYISDQNENDLNSRNFNNSLAERVKVKVMDQPTKETITYLELNEPVKTDRIVETDTIKKRTPIIKVKVRLSKDSSDKINSATSSFESSLNEPKQSFETPENLVQNSYVRDENSCNSVEQILAAENTKHNVENGCIFDENKSRPLSPIPTPISLHFRAVEDLIDYHERQITRPAGRTTSKAPLMGTTALLNRSHESKLSLNDSEIISALVHDRFVVNMFESRTYRRSIRKKPSNYGRIYKSLERTVCTDSPSNGELKHTRIVDNTFPNIICVQQSSPIQLNKQSVSLQTKNISSTARNSSEECAGDSVSQGIDHNSCPPFETKCDDDNAVLPSNNMSDRVTDMLAEIQNDGEIVDKHDAEHYSTETTAELCSSESQNDVSSNAETDICESLLDSISNLSATSTVKTTSESNLITPETKQDSVDSIEKLFDNSVSTDLSYNMEEFLEKALGEELCNYTNLDSTTDVISKKEMTNNPTSKAILQEDSVCTSDASDLVSKINSIQSNFCRSLTKKLQHMSDTLKFSNSQKQEGSDVTGNDLSSIFPNNEEVTTLVQQAAVQYEAMKQITKALTLCRNMKEFCVSSEQVEGERLLLVATYKRQAILDEIRRLDYELDENTASTETGTLMISGVSLPLKDDTVEQVPVRREQKYWYVCIFSYGPRVVATQPTLASSERIVQFTEEVIFTELPSDFTINLEVYCLSQRRGSRNFSHESKYHINKSTKSSHCPAPKKFLHREKLAQKNSARYDTGIRTSSFKLCGCMKLRVADLAKPGPWFMRKVPLCSALNGAVTMNLQQFVQIPIRHAGFLTIGTESGGCTAWNRRWCVVDGPMLRFWNYPSDEDTCDPLQEVDLKNCANARIEIADRTLCARARTLLLETVTPEDKSCTIDKHFLSTDTGLEMKIWETKLNTIVSALRTWNVAYF
ncbi:scraps [Carabus blaptoides fortunei]